MKRLWKSKSFSAFVTFCLIGVLFIGIAIHNGGAVLKPGRDLYADDFRISDVKEGTHIKTDFYASAGMAAVLETTMKSGGSSSKTYNDFYLVPVFDAASDNTYWMGVRVNDSEEDSWENLTDITYDYLNGSSTEFGDTVLSREGLIEEADDSLYSYWTSYAVECGLADSSEDAESIILPYYVNTNEDTASFFVFLGIGIAGLLLAALTAVITITSSKKKEKKAAEAQAALNNMGVQQFNGV